MGSGKVGEEEGVCSHPSKTFQETLKVNIRVLSDSAPMYYLFAAVYTSMFKLAR